MQQIDWNTFGLKGESKQKSFEDLCMFLCCRELKITKIDSYQNQPGIETEPFEANSKKYGFQAKFFDSKFDWKQVKSSILKGLRLYPDLDKIFVYSNKDRTKNGSKKTNYETDIDKDAEKQKTEIEYMTDKDILLKLSQPSNLDLAQLYFGIGDELGFIKNSVSPKLLTFIQSQEYLDLPCVNDKKEKVTVSNEVLNNETKKVFLLTGNPGTGKSIFMHKLLEVFGGLDKKKEDEMVKVLTDNSAVPVLINLKNCINDSLENIIRGRKNDSKVNSQELGFIYLFDGLDELDEKIADNVLFQMFELSQKANTKIIIISCRSGNLNKIMAKTYFNDIIEYQISNLEEKYINDYFSKKNDKSKQDKLKTLKKYNQSIVQEIGDILLVKLLWDTIEELNESSTILDLLNKKIDLLLDDPNHRKNIEHLNLLNTKKEQILRLNQDISFEFHKKFQFRFSQDELQKIILNRFDRLDYEATNSIISYLADLFFENSYATSSELKTSYIYQHRRYQEYFFTQKLKSEYEKNPSIIRELKILSNREYLENLFRPYLRKEYEKENNLPGLVELNLIDVYLGKHKGFGVDDDYYMNSSEFIPALVAQDKSIFNELFENENLQINEKISIDFQELEKKFEKWNKDKNDYRSNDYLKSVWGNGVASLIEIVVLLWKSDNTEIAKEFRQQLQNIMNLYDQYKFSENLKENDRLEDPFWNQFENWIYYRLVIKNETVKDLFDSLVRENYKNFSNSNDWSYKEDGKEKLVKSFFRVCLKEKRNDFYKLIDDFDEYEFVALLEIFKSIEYLPIFAQSKSIHKKIKSFINEFSQEINERNVFILFYKRYFNIKLSKKEKEAVNPVFEKLKNADHFDLTHNKKNRDFAIVSYILDTFSFEKFLKKQDGHPFRYYNELGLYSALFNDFISLLKGEKEIESIVRDYIRYINFYFEGTYYGKYLKVDMSFFWANIFSLEKDDEKLLQLKKILIKEENNIIPFSFFLQLNRIIPSRFSKIVSKNDLTLIEDQLSNWDDDFPSYVDRCFDLSMFFSKIDQELAKYYFTKAVLEGILRHGWHKDTIVSYLLTDAFEVIWRNNWVDNKKKESYAREVFDLTMHVVQITDGDHTWRGPYLVIEIIANTNIELAEQFKKELIEAKGYHNFSNQVITSILKAKVKNGVEVEKIEEEMSEYRKDYGHEGKPRSDYYEQKFIIYLEITESNLYTEEEQKEAFQKSYKQIEEIQKQQIDYYLRDDDFGNEKLRFQKLCKKYNKLFNLEFDKQNTDENSYLKKKRNISEEQFIKEVKACKTSMQITGKYKKLDNYNNGIILKTYRSWEILIQKTFEINKNLKLLLDYLLKNNFPHTDFWTSNSKYFHLPLAIALKDINTRQEALNYLFKNSGHGGFQNIIKSYEVIEDKNMCLSLFDRYIKFCRLIVN
ncbi:MAG: hypothetical protein COX80_02335 [Candidatus Magasanikbacteria bacterium CG_4_10_14_0_2_um_filter_33_14]|uniref:NACHT domain-containing protein n=1 Tax=Candidatus Magasanikbacteria bacterium CG_4_10_14_0_2_um_filter_33_14 TaxID=1974636 RepID=A0A2M7VB43_9BACT|nr:MAG: hypothetical protein COX80_02335 [Candidatus Magasanikbacteria bacterium CG_4_10_14_0_2_um_filter_33_14]